MEEEGEEEEEPETVKVKVANAIDIPSQNSQSKLIMRNNSICNKHNTSDN